MKIKKSRLKRIISEEIERDLNEGLLDFLKDQFASFFKSSSKNQEKTQQKLSGKIDAASNTQVKNVAKDLGSSAKDYESLDPKDEKDVMVWSIVQSQMLPQVLTKMLLNINEILQWEEIFPRKSLGEEKDVEMGETTGSLFGAAHSASKHLGKHMKTFQKLNDEFEKNRSSPGLKGRLEEYLTLQRFADAISSEVVPTMSKALEKWPKNVKSYNMKQIEEGSSKLKKIVPKLVAKLKTEIENIKKTQKESILRKRPLQIEKIMRRMLSEGFVEYKSLSDSELLEYVATGDSLAKEEYQKRIEDDDYLAEVDEIPLPSRRHRFFEVDKK